MSNVKKRILVTDDDEATLDFMEKALADAGYDVFTATSGEQAVQIAATTDIDLALLDHRLTGLSGLETGRALYRLSMVRFVLMSAYPDQDLVAKAADEGALQFLSKPVRRSDLLNTVTVCLARAAEIKNKEKSLKELEGNFSNAVARGIASARSVNTVLGMLMKDYKKTRDHAYKILMRLSQNESRKAVELSEDIIREFEAQCGGNEDSESDDSGSTKK